MHVGGRTRTTLPDPSEGRPGLIDRPPGIVESSRSSSESGSRRVLRVVRVRERVRQGVSASDRERVDNSGYERERESLSFY